MYGLVALRSTLSVKVLESSLNVVSLSDGTLSGAFGYNFGTLDDENNDLARQLNLLL